MNPTGYTRTQIVLHWAVALLILPQFLYHDAIAGAWRAIVRGETPELGFPVQIHIIVGVLIGSLVVWRMAIKARRGAPPPPANEPPLLQLGAKLAHLGLSALLLLLVLTGLAGWFGDVRIALEVHEVLTTLLLVLVGLHVVGALYHRFVLRNHVMQRMVRPQK